MTDAANTYNHSSGNLTSSPVTDQPMIIRWISDVPSKIVKILDYGTISAVQRPVRLCAWMAKASSNAVTAASTTTSVRAIACTTGSTAGVCAGMS